MTATLTLAAAAALAQVETLVSGAAPTILTLVVTALRGAALDSVTLQGSDASASGFAGSQLTNVQIS